MDRIPLQVSRREHRKIGLDCGWNACYRRSPSQLATFKLELHYEMTCGQPGAGPVLLQLPARMGVPRTLAARIGTKPAPAAVSGHSVTVRLPKPPVVTCMSIGPGTLTLYLVGVRNPTIAGTYFVHARVNEHSFIAQLAVRS